MSALNIFLLNYPRSRLSLVRKDLYEKSYYHQLACHLRNTSKYLSYKNLSSSIVASVVRCEVIILNHSTHEYCLTTLGKTTRLLTQLRERFSTNDRQDVRPATERLKLEEMIYNYVEL